MGQLLGEGPWTTRGEPAPHGFRRLARVPPPSHRAGGGRDAGDCIKRSGSMMPAHTSAERGCGTHGHLPRQALPAPTFAAL